MNNTRFDLKKYLIPSDAIYIVVIVIGLFILVFLGELPVRLIGACIALLSAVVLVMNISQRLKDRVEFRRPSVSQPVELSMKVKKDSAGTRYVFDDFESNFGGDDVPTEEEDSVLESVGEEKPAARMQESRSNERTHRSSADRNEPKRLRFDDTEGTVEEVESRTRRDNPYRTETQTTPESRKEQRETARSAVKTLSFGGDDMTMEFSDETSGVRIVGKKQEITSNVDKVLKIENEPDVSIDFKRSDTTNNSKKQQKDKRREKKQLKQERQRELEEQSENDLAPETAVLPPVMLSDDDASTQPESVEEERSHRIKQHNIALADLIDDIEHPGNDEPRKEFDHLLSRVLMVIRSMMSARTAAFFWVNIDKSELVLEAHITDAPDIFGLQRKYPLGMDIVSQIANSGRPEILTEIKASAERDLIPYYTEQAGTLSFVGVPVYLNHTVIGVLCADSTLDDAYDELTIGTLGHFTKLISGLTQSYTGKYDLLQSSRTLDALSQFRALVSQPERGVGDLSAALVECSRGILDYQTIGVALYDSERETWAISSMSSKVPQNEILQGETIEINNSLIARTIFSGTTTSIVPVDINVRRYHPNEMLIDNGFFVAVPLKSTSHNYGALFVEGHATQLTQKDVAILETLGEQTGMMIEQMHVQEMLQANSLTDESTGLLNGAAFIQRMSEELVRSKDFKTPFVLTLLTIDRYDAIEKNLGESEREEIFHHVLEHVRHHARAYDVLGRLDTNIIGWGTSGIRDSELQLVAERLRKEIAISVREINKKRFTVTVSIGIARSVESDSVETLATNANKAMEMAAAKTNSVVLFS